MSRALRFQPIPVPPVWISLVTGLAALLGVALILGALALDDTRLTLLGMPVIACAMLLAIVCARGPHGDAIGKAGPGLRRAWRIAAGLSGAFAVGALLTSLAAMVWPALKLACALILVAAMLGLLSLQTVRSLAYADARMPEGGP